MHGTTRQSPTYLRIHEQVAMVHRAFRKGAVAVVTGLSYGGIGFAVVHKLATVFGMKVALADISQEHLATAEQKLLEAGVSKEDMLICRMDVSKRDEYESFANDVCGWTSSCGSVLC
jgi:NAD(P)-dependent dehydrogenase (short-subunit alcohol dehydrogenase family)